MATFCSVTGTCTATNVISIGAIIGIVIGSLSALAILLAIIVIICILCKKKRQPVVFVQPPVSQVAAGYNPSMNMGSYPPYGQYSGFNAPPPTFQQQNIPMEK